METPEKPKFIQTSIPLPEQSDENFTETQTSKRGRKAGGKNRTKEEIQAEKEAKLKGEQKPQPKKTASSSAKSEDDFFANASKIADENKKDEAQIASPENQPLTEESKQLLSGYMLLVILDAFVPKLVCKFILKKKTNIKRLDKKQKEELEPIANEAAKVIFSSIDPVKGFLLAYTVMTISNNMEDE